MKRKIIGFFIALMGLVFMGCLSSPMIENKDNALEQNKLYINSEIYFVTASTEDGKLYQKAPTSVSFPDFVAIGSMPTSIQYGFVGIITHPFGYESLLRSLTKYQEGVITNDIKINCTIDIPDSTNLFPLPSGLNSTVQGSQISILQLFGSVNIPWYKFEKDTFYWLSSNLGQFSLSDSPDTYKLKYTDSIECLYLYSNEKCEINGTTKDPYFDITYTFDNIGLIKGWNLIRFDEIERTGFFQKKMNATSIPLDSMKLWITNYAP
jgi:hypothetical protein